MKKLIKNWQYMIWMMAIFVAFGASQVVYAVELANGPVHVTTIQSDGKTIIGGLFTTYGGVTRNGIARLNVDGTLDDSFDPGAGLEISDGSYSASGCVTAAIIQPDGKIIIGGVFTTYDGITANGIARLNTDGSLDSTFNSGAGTDMGIWTSNLQVDGKIIVGGYFTTYDGVSVNNFARLNADGSLDTTFNIGTGPNGTVYAINVQADGKIIVGGIFSDYNGSAQNNIVRLNADGTIDATFDSGTGIELSVGNGGGVSAVSIQPDGKILLGGAFFFYDGIAINTIVRLNIDGSLDTTFNPGLGMDNVPWNIAIQSDGKILIGGAFSTYDGVSRKGIARINVDGSLDTSLDPGTGVTGVLIYDFGTNGYSMAATPQANGKIIINGYFTTYNDIPSNGIARLSSDGSLDTTFGEPAAVTSPTFITQALTPTNITDTTATGQGNITDTGGEDPVRLIEWGTTSGVYTNSCSAGTGGVGDYSCDLTGLTPNTTYYVRATATNSAGTTTGDETSFTTTNNGTVPDELVDNTIIPEETPPAEKITDESCLPTKLNAKGISTTQAKLTWKDNCGMEDGYDIERRIGEDKFEKIASVDKNKESYTDKNLEPDTTYEYRIRATKKKDESDYSNKEIAKTFPEEEIIVVGTEELTTVDTTDMTNAIDPETLTADTVALGETDSENPTNASQSEQQAIPATIQTKNEQISTMQAIANDPAVQKTSTAIEVIGLLTGATIAYAATTGMAIPLFPTSPNPFAGSFSRIFSFFGFIGRTKKKDNDWGIVFDAETRMPVSAAVISVIDKDNRIIDSTVTDSQGRYGFLANDGTYTIRVQKDGYEMESEETVDEFYGKIYTGKEFEVARNEMVKMNIAMTNTKVDWHDFAKRKIAAYTSVFSVIKKDLFVIIFYVGFFAAAVIMYYVPNMLNGVILAIYVILAIHRIFFKTKSFGLITNDQNMPVPFSMVSLYNEENPTRRIAFAISDVIGRYYLLASDGEYLMKVQGQELEGKAFSKLMRVEVRDGILKNDVQV